MEKIDPRSLLRPERVDILAKLAFFQDMVCGGNETDVEIIYRRHILLRTGGREPADFRGNASDKASIDDYVRRARELFRSMRERGFDETQPVPIGANGLPMNGAHRIACAMALGIELPVERVADPALSWDWSWFPQGAFSKSDRLRLLAAFAEAVPHRTAVFVLWPHVLDHWDRIVQDMAAGGLQAVGTVDPAFGAEQIGAYHSLVYDLYSHGAADVHHGMAHIDRKIGFLSERPAFVRVGIATSMVSAGNDFYACADRVKAQIRSDYDHAVPQGHFVTCHLSSSEAETLHMARTLLQPSNLRAASRRSVVQPRSTFMAWFQSYRSLLSSTGLDPSNCCIVGSGALEIAGVRLATDIDFTVRADVRAARFGTGPANQQPDIDVVSEGYHRVTTGRRWSDDELISRPGLHVLFRGMKVAATSIVRDRKGFSGRAKDLLDCELIDFADKATAFEQSLDHREVMEDGSDGRVEPPASPADEAGSSAAEEEHALDGAEESRTEAIHLREEVERLRAAVGERDGRIAALLASSSWRITQPLRAAKGILQSLRGRYGQTRQG